MRFEIGDSDIEIGVTGLTIAGWTGRDAGAVQHHIDELAAIGVAPPSTVPLYYRTAHSLLTQEAGIEVLGDTTSGEVEPVLIQAEGALFLGLGSDHTDRALEVVSVAASKQACAKPISGALWPFDEVAPHLDDLELRCEIEEGGEWVTYQQGHLAAIRPLQSLAAGAELVDDQAMFCGTLGAIGGVRPAVAYRMRLHDPHRGRSLLLDYRVRSLPVIS